MKTHIKSIIKSCSILVCIYNFVYGFWAWFINYIVSSIPFWTIRKIFYIISGMKIGKGSRIGLHTRVISPSKIRIGKRTIINEFCHLDGRGGLNIGDDSSISIYSKIITASHVANSDTFEYYEKGVSIANHVWIGCNAIILDGSILSSGCIVGAGTVIKKNVKQNEIWVGNPAKKIKERDCWLEYKIDYHPFFK